MVVNQIILMYFYNRRSALIKLVHYSTKLLDQLTRGFLQNDTTFLISPDPEIKWFTKF